MAYAQEYLDHGVKVNFEFVCTSYVLMPIATQTLASSIEPFDPYHSIHFGHPTVRIAVCKLTALGLMMY